MRAEDNYYPTPPEAGLALLAFIEETGIEIEDAIDPAAGAGALPRWLKPLGATWRLYELNSGWAPALAGVGEEFSVTFGDSLSADWPLCPVIANPPFGSDLPRFMAKIHDHCRVHGELGCVLVPAPWWGEGKRAQMWRPDVLLWMTKRLSFDGRNQVPTTHVWSIFLPEPLETTTVVWAATVTPTREQLMAHRAMMTLDPRQMELM